MTLGPLLLGVSLTATSYAVSVARGYGQIAPHGFGVVIAVLEFVLFALGVAALFHYVPNTHVRWRHALAGGLFVAVGIAGAKRLLALYFSTVPTYSVVYGAFATVPIFLIWIYLELGGRAARRGDRRLRAGGRHAPEALAGVDRLALPARRWRCCASWPRPRDAGLPGLTGAGALAGAARPTRCRSIRCSTPWSASTGSAAWTSRTRPATCCSSIPRRRLPSR